MGFNEGSGELVGCPVRSDFVDACICKNCDPIVGSGGINKPQLLEFSLFS